MTLSKCCRAKAVVFTVADIGYVCASCGRSCGTVDSEFEEKKLEVGMSADELARRSYEALREAANKTVAAKEWGGVNEPREVKE